MRNRISKSNSVPIIFVEWPLALQMQYEIGVTSSKSEIEEMQDPMDMIC